MTRLSVSELDADAPCDNWFPLTGDERLGQCASDDCGGQPTWRMEAGGIGANYCSGCKAKIVAVTARNALNQENHNG